MKYQVDSNLLRHIYYYKIRGTEKLSYEMPSGVKNRGTFCTNEGEGISDKNGLQFN